MIRYARAHPCRATNVRSGERPDRAATTGTGARGTTKAVITSHDLTIFERLRIDIPKKKPLAPSIGGPLHSELLIKIAIVHFAAPANADRVAAHQSVDSRWIKGVDQHSHVITELVIVPQITRKAANREIRNRVKFIENNGEMRSKF